MSDRLVRFTESFFEDLDDQLPEERSASGAPSATDFLLYDLPRLRDALASGYGVDAARPRSGPDPSSRRDRHTGRRSGALRFSTNAMMSSSSRSKCIRR